MGVNSEKTVCIFETEAAWSDANKKMLCLDTGDWRTQRPVIDYETCNRCGLCFIYCSPQCIRVDDAEEKFVPDLAFCKGCGVCARECPKKAITMTPEGEYADECSAE